MLYQRDLRQLEVEDLGEMLEQSKLARDRVLYPGAGGPNTAEWINNVTRGNLSEEDKERERQQKVDAMNREIEEVRSRRAANKPPSLLRRARS